MELRIVVNPRLHDARARGIKKISPLVALCLIGLVIGGIGAALYWTSNSLTRTISVKGWIEACSNFDILDTVDISTYAELKAACDTDMNTVIRVATDGSNAETCFTTLYIDCPPGYSVTAVAHMYVLSEGGNSGTVELGPIATDGIDSIQVIYSGNPTWLYESDYAADDIHVLFFMLTFNMDPDPPIGDYGFTATVTLGDNLIS